jgi:predicted  nucleic acid-binding Zn-ribbon protein
VLKVVGGELQTLLMVFSTITNARPKHEEIGEAMDSDDLGIGNSEVQQLKERVRELEEQLRELESIIERQMLQNELQQEALSKIVRARNPISSRMLSPEDGSAEDFPGGRPSN